MLAGTLALLVPILVPLGTMAMVVLLVWFSHATRRKEKERQAEIVRQMIDKFSTGEAFAQAIQGHEGSRLAQALALENDEPPKKMWRGLLIPASILTSMGVGFFILGWVEDDDFLVPALVLGSVGLGLSLATYVMWRVEERGGDGVSDGEREKTSSMRASAGADTDGL